MRTLLLTVILLQSPAMAGFSSSPLGTLYEDGAEDAGFVWGGHTDGETLFEEVLPAAQLGPAELAEWCDGFGDWVEAQGLTWGETWGVMPQGTEQLYLDACDPA